MPHIDPENVLWKEIDGKVIVLHISSADFLELNGSAGAIWKLIAEGNDADAIVNTMAEIYNVSRKQLTRDVGKFIARMAAKGLLRP